MSVVTITDFVEEKDAVFYNINVRLPLRSLLVLRRYSEFLSLLQDLCSELGISPSDFPYELPAKGGLFSGKAKLAAARIRPLEKFLNNVIRDRDLQNRKPVHAFLELPRNFKFAAESFLKNPDDADYDDNFLLNMNAQSVDSSNWLMNLRIINSSVARMKGTELSNKVSLRSKIDKYILPAIGVLELSLKEHFNTGEITKAEYNRRTSSLQALKSDVQSKSTVTSNAWNYEKTSNIHKKVQDKPEETNDTIALSNQELLQRQQQVHKEQDQELEELRKAIANQRRIGEAINKEVSEQNEILDSLSYEVEASNAKLENARARTRKIG